VTYWIELHGWKIAALLFALPGIAYFILAAYSTMGYVLTLGLFGVSMAGVVFALYVFYIWLSRRQVSREVRDRELDLERRMHLPAGMLGKGPLHLEDGGPARRQEKALDE
jgi:membrane protein implicated in regulation of membrane protease activity